MSARVKAAREERGLAEARDEAVRAARALLAAARGRTLGLLPDAAADMRQTSGRLCCAFGLLRDAATRRALAKGRARSAS